MPRRAIKLVVNTGAHGDISHALVRLKTRAFNLWRHAGAVAGVNLPTLVFSDLAGPAIGTFPRAAGVRSCSADDLQAARSERIRPAR
jgi:hypothetical protein